MITTCPRIGRNAFIFKRLLTYEKILFWTQNHLMAHNRAKNKRAHTQLSRSSPRSWESHSSEGFWWQLHLLSRCKPCEPSGGWRTAARQRQPRYRSRVSVLSWGLKKHSTNLQLTGSFPSERVSEEKHSYSKAEIFYGRFFSLEFLRLLSQNLK